MQPQNVLYAQSGGVTAVINATAAGVIQTARQYPQQMAKVYAAENGIVGALNERLFDTSIETNTALNALLHTPGGAFGSCRYRLKDMRQDSESFERLYQVFKAHNIGYFFYNGGGDSQDTTHKVEQYCRARELPVTCVGIPKTIDNDLLYTDCCPGFGSVAKYVATSTLEAALDIASMCQTSTKIFIFEVMGRNSGWIAAASGLAGNNSQQPPHLILFPEIPFDPSRFLVAVHNCVDRYGFCVIVASEGVRDQDGKLIAGDGQSVDAFGHTQLGGCAIALAKLIKSELGIKYHFAIADYLQRAARHLASQVDIAQAQAVGQAAVQMAIEGESGVMVTIERLADQPYRWRTGSVALEKVANAEKTIPAEFINADGWGITPMARNYLAPLIEGEAYTPFAGGLPKVTQLRKKIVPAKLPPFNL